MANAQEAARCDIEKAKEEAARMAIALKRHYEGEISWLEGLLRDNQSHNEKVTRLEAQLLEERSAAKAQLA